MANKPLNLIIITFDEMRADALGFMGNRVCATPNADAFAARGVVFTNHFTVHGKCVPSRIAMQTGRYSHTDGFRTINLHLPPESPSLCMRLKRMGYETAYFGHNHVWENFWGEDSVKGAGVTDYHSFTKGVFDHMLEREWPVPQPGPDSVTPADLSKLRYDYAGRTVEPLSFFKDDNRAEQAIAYLRTVRDRSRPFYLHLNFGKPHPPYTIEEPYFSMYDRTKLDSYPHTLPANAPLHMRAMRELRSGLEAPDEALNEIQAVYYGMVTKVDLLLGRVLEAVEREGLLENSIVIFTTDHGDFAGQYGLVEKWDTSMADCLLRAPLVLCAPGLAAGTRIESLTEHVDLPSTVLDLLGTAPDWGVHGESLLPVIRGERRKDAVFADGGHEHQMWARFNFRGSDKPGGKPLNGKQTTYRDVPESMARTKMVRTDRWKLVVRLVGGNELYDMHNDPWELDNLYPSIGQRPDLASVVQQLQLRMLEWCLRTDTDRPWEDRVGA